MTSPERVESAPPPPGAVPAAAIARRPLLERADVLPMLALVGLGLVLRLVWWSGFGLGDDVNFRNNIWAIVQNYTVVADNIAYRVTWWLPTAVSCRLFGLNEVGLVLPVTVMATLGTALVYVFGNALYGRAGAVIATLLVVFLPLDFAWSTMLANDFFGAFFATLTILLVIRAPIHPAAAGRRRLWMLAALSLWLAVHAKVASVLLGPAIVAIALAHWRRLDREVLAFAGTAAVLFGLTAAASYAFTGNPIAPYHAEYAFGGASGPDAVRTHPLTRHVFWTYPRLLFSPTHVGDLLYSIYPHLLVLLALLAPLLGLRSSWAVFWWLAFTFLGMQFAMNRVDGVWTSAARNARHTIVFVHPLALLLAGFLVSLRRRAPRATAALLAVVLAVSARESIAVASKMQRAFADRREALAYITSLPPKPIHSDFQVCTWLPILDLPPQRWRCVELHAWSPPERRARIAPIRHGYLVTGGSREPMYGCYDCIPRAGDLDPARWRLLRQWPFDGPATPWRPEALRVWEAVEPEAAG